MKHVRGLLIAGLIAAPGCSGDQPDLGLQAVWREAKDLPLGQIVWLEVRDVGLGALLGGAMGFLVFITLKRLGCYRIVGRLRIWGMIAIGLFMILGGGVLGAGIGNLQAGADIARLGIRETGIGKKALPAVGELAADIVALAEQMLLHEKAIDEVGVDAFQKGEAAVDVQLLIQRVNQLQKGTAKALADRAIDRALGQNPDWRGGTTETVARWSLPRVAEYLVDEHVRREMVQFGIPDFFDDLAAVARQKPDGKMTRAEMGQFFADRVLGPALMKPIGKAVWNAQIVLMLVAVAGAFAPIGVIELIRRFVGAGEPGASATGGESVIKPMDAESGQQEV